MGLNCEWDKDKARQNLAKHGVSFDDAATVFSDPFSLTIPDPVHSGEEERFVTIGQSFQQRTLVITHTDRGDRVRIISARLPTPRERKQYAEGE